MVTYVNILKFKTTITLTSKEVCKDFVVDKKTEKAGTEHFTTVGIDINICTNRLESVYTAKLGLLIFCSLLHYAKQISNN